jgi:hypothetical protein
MRFYNAMKCDWYAHVIIVTAAEPKLSGRARAIVVLGDAAQPLSFGDPVWDDCLSSVLAEKLLAASGWKSGVILGELVTWVYRKGHTRLDFAAVEVAPDRDSCIVQSLIPDEVDHLIRVRKPVWDDDDQD